MSAVANDVAGQVRPGVLSLSIKERSALFAAYMPFIKGGGLFIPTNKTYKMGEEVFMLLTLMDERMPSQRNGVAFDATGHDDPRRTDLAALMRRPPGVPRRPYDVRP